MIEVLLKIYIATFFLILLGIYNKKKKINFSELAYSGVLGFVYISIIAIVLNFFVPLNTLNNSVVFIIILFFLIMKRRRLILFNYKKILLFTFLLSLFSTSLILFSDSYRPDSGLYHYPYVNILNESKIITGLSNLHFRFGHISIIQYTSAFFNNHFFSIQGITIPLVLLIAFVIFYLSTELIEYSKKENYRFYVLFNSCILIYCAFKLNRYSEYGNDAPGHILSFFLISIFIKNYFEKKFKNLDLLLISSYIFTIKSTLIFYLIIPIFQFLKTRFRNFFELKNFLAIFFLLFWFTKNFLISSCILYPMNFSCLQNVSWHNSNFQNSVTEIQVRSEAWNKDWPNRTDKNIKQEDYIKNFNWISVWSKNHFLKVLNTLGIYSCLLLIFYFFINFQNNKYKNTSSKKEKMYEFKGNYLILFICFIGIISWFLKAPIYRYGYSYIIILISLLFSIYSSKNSINIPIAKFNKYSLYLLIIVFSVFFIKQANRISNVSTYIYSLEPWPKFYGMDKLNSSPVLKKIKINNYIIYKSSTECMYSKSPCTNIPIDKNLNIIKKNNYYIIYHHKNN